jgi:glycosyltransferase involved in cell wall biosynthesis
MPKTSVIVCSYNGQSYLREQLNSLLNQDKLPDEIIIIDDCSKDNSWDLICDFKNSNTHIIIRTFRNDNNIGFVNNFSQAIKLATNEIVFFCDQDDVWSDKKISTVFQHFITDPLLTCFHTNAEIVNENLQSSGKDLFSTLKVDKREMNAMKTNRYFEVLLRRNVVTGATMAVRRDMLVKSLPIPPDWIHDEWIPIVNSLAGKVAFDNKLLIKYRIHDRNTVGLGDGGSNFKTLLNRGTVKSFYEARISKLSHLRNRGITNPSQSKYLEDYISHLQWRLSVAILPYPKRIRPIIGQVLDGSYSQFSRGIFSAIRDFFSS